MLEGYADDVLVMTPLFALGDPIQDNLTSGKAALREFLLVFIRHYGGFQLEDLLVSPGPVLVTAQPFAVA